MMSRVALGPLLACALLVLAGTIFAIHDECSACKAVAVSGLLVGPGAYLMRRPACAEYAPPARTGGRPLEPLPSSFVGV